jgi:hypothetical protein
MKLASCSAFFLVFSVSLAGQILHTATKSCGNSEVVPPVAQGVTATVDKEGHAELFIGGGTAGIDLEGNGVIYQIAEVCSLTGGRLAVFGDVGNGAIIDIVDVVKQSLVDSFWGFGPVISPDRRWIAFRNPYPPVTDASDVALIYDLTKSPDKNRPVGNKDRLADVGAVIFPLGINDASVDTVGLPDEQVHYLVSGYSWAPDSRAIAFVESTPAIPRQAVLVTLDGQGGSTAFVHPLSNAEMCGPGFAGEPEGMQVKSIEVGPSQAGDRLVTADFKPYNPSCLTHTVQLHQSDFQPAKPEVHEVEAPGKPLIINGHMAMPKKKGTQQGNDAADKPQQ